MFLLDECLQLTERDAPHYNEMMIQRFQKILRIGLCLGTRESQSYYWQWCRLCRGTIEEKGRRKQEDTLTMSSFTVPQDFSITDSNGSPCHFINT